MKKNESVPLSNNFLISNEFHAIENTITESIPVFLLPFGFNALSLFQIAQFYDGSGREFFRSLIFNDNFPPFSQNRTVDYSYYFSQCLIHQLPNELSYELSDRFFDSDKLLELFPLGSLSFKSFQVPKGKESGITQILSQSNNYSAPHVFSLSSAPLSSIPPAVVVTIAQPALLNKVIQNKYGNIESMLARENAIKADVASLKYNEFQIDWAIGTLNGSVVLILCRPPQFIQIKDMNINSFSTVEKAFEYVNIYLLCYRHSKFISKIGFNKVTPVVISSSACKGNVTVIYSPCRPIEADSIYCNILHQEMSNKFNFDFESYIIYSLRFPSFYLSNASFDEDVSMAAAVLIDQGRCASLFIENMDNNLMKTAIFEYNKFCYWLRSLIRVFKAINNNDINKITETILACFKSLPVRNQYIMVSMVLISIQSIKRYRQHKNQNEEFFQLMLVIFKHVLGDEFDQVLGIQKWEVPRSLRNQVVNIDSCVNLFYSTPFKKQRKTINSVIQRFSKYFDPIKNIFSFMQNPLRFKLCPSYVDFLKLQAYDTSIEI